MEISSKQIFDKNFKNFFYSPRYGIKSEISMLDIHLEQSFKVKKVLEINTKFIPK